MSETTNPVPFDYQVDKKDPKTGQVIERKDYRLDIRKDGGGNSIQFVESPIGTGKWHHVNGAVLSHEELVAHGFVKDAATKKEDKKPAEK